MSNPNFMWTNTDPRYAPSPSYVNWHASVESSLFPSTTNARPQHAEYLERAASYSPVSPVSSSCYHAFETAPSLDVFFQRLDCAVGLPTAPSTPTATYTYPCEEPPLAATAVRLLPSQQPIRCYDHGCDGRRFSSLGNYRRHIREKAQLAKTFQCPTCGKVFTRSTARNLHQEMNKCRDGAIDMVFAVAQYGDRASFSLAQGLNLC
ncbi:hypothetical protein B0O99DRAFT_335786 [Bisporella sp. PMI_857]|nr:hypothetical protein B0O99DRAFT_335786 [Bisporella sp. PMI_857]